MQIRILFTMTIFMSMLLSAFSNGSAGACSDVMLKKEGAYGISCRTMDFSCPLGSKFVVVPRGQRCRSTTPTGKKGLAWTSRYGFVGVNVQDRPVYSDGLNEKGLSAAVLWLLGTDYPVAGIESRTLAVEDCAGWILGSFSTVAQLKKGLEKVQITGHFLEEMHMLPPLHLAVHDAAGHSLVIEFLEKEMVLFDNGNGVLTNEPDFRYQTANLQYRKWKLGLARSAVGVPGEWYPVERFIRASIVREALPAPKSLAQAVSQAVHVLNTVQVQYGAPGTDSEGGPEGAYDHTLWSLIRDHRNLSLYYRSMNNPSLQRIDLKSLDFSGTAAYEPIPVAGGDWFIPVSLKNR